MFSVETQLDATVIHVADELDLTTRQSLQRMIALAELSPPRIIVSLLNCGYCDASCIGVLLSSRARIGSRFFVVLDHASIIGEIVNLCLQSRDADFIVSSIRDAQDRYLPTHDQSLKIHGGLMTVFES